SGAVDVRWLGVAIPTECHDAVADRHIGGHRILRLGHVRPGARDGCPRAGLAWSALHPEAALVRGAFSPGDPDGAAVLRYGAGLECCRRRHQRGGAGRPGERREGGLAATLLEGADLVAGCGSGSPTPSV